MSPETYLSKIARDIFHSYKQMELGIDEDKIKNIKDRASKDFVFPMPVLDYEAKTQEGRNRAFVAKEQGIEKIPVYVVKKLLKEEVSNLAEKYKYKGIERDLFDFIPKPKFKEGDIVVSTHEGTIGRRMKVVGKIWSYDYFKDKGGTHPPEKSPQNWWLYGVKRLDTHDIKPDEVGKTNKELMKDENWLKNNLFAEFFLEKAHANEGWKEEDG